MKIGFLFPGQGSQMVGMGKDLYENYKEVKEIYDEAERVTGIDIKKISFEGPEEILNQTQYTQIAILINSLAILKVLEKNNVKAELMAGLSLGEYTALIKDEIFELEAGIKLVQKRGEIMQNAIPKGKWKMAAIIGLDEVTVQELCKDVKNGFVVPANYNTIGQIVISGEENAVFEAGEKAKEKGARKIMILNTSGPFHTQKLLDASKLLRTELQKVNIKNKESRVIKNIDGEMYKINDDIVDILSKHIMQPVQFTKVLEKMYESGVDAFIEIGSGKTLSGFVKRMKFAKQVKIMNINDTLTLEKVIKEVKEYE